MWGTDHAYDETQAGSALERRAKASQAPAVVLSACKDGTFRLIEASAEGHVTLKLAEELYEYRWTDRRGTVEEITLVNSYCVALVSYTERENYWQFTVSHGTEDLEPAVRAAIAEARDDPSWKPTYVSQPIKSVGLRESEFVDTGYYDLPVPEGLSEDRDKPTILVELSPGGRIDDVRLVGGQAHLAVLDPVRQTLDLYRHECSDGQADFLHLRETGVDHEAAVDRLVDHAVRHRGFELPAMAEPQEIPF